jgi:Protein of unknown function (DUF2442)
MNIPDDPRVTRATSTRDSLIVDFEDGRPVHFPLMWHPRLYRATETQRDHYELTGHGFGVPWPDLDEDLSARGLAYGQPSIEFIKQQRKAKPEGAAA